MARFFYPVQQCERIPKGFAIFEHDVLRNIGWACPVVFAPFLRAWSWFRDRYWLWCGKGHRREVFRLSEIRDSVRRSKAKAWERGIREGTRYGSRLKEFQDIEEIKSSQVLMAQFPGLAKRANPKPFEPKNPWGIE